MVKGISRQVIVVQSPEPKLFDQAIFILNEKMGEGITEEALLNEAKQIIRGREKAERKRHLYLYGVFWTGIGALLTGLAWLLTVLF